MKVLRRALVGITGLAAVLATTAAMAPASVGATTTTTWVPKPMCAQPTAGHKACLGIRLVKKRVSLADATTRQADAVRRSITRDSQLGGPAGGFTPMDLAKAYGVNPGAAAGASQTVAIVDAYNDPSVRYDLDYFNAEYGLPAETARSFRVVDQRGASIDPNSTTTPAPDEGWAGEITLDVQAVRGLCHQCKLLLVEADSDSDQDLADAVDTAVRLGATEVTNSYGGAETDLNNTAGVSKAYDHPGVVITASSGDDGWHDWDVFNETAAGNSVDKSANTPEAPASYPTVVGVGGTSLYLNPDSTRASETVWNSNGPADFDGYLLGAPLGASGSGCSTTYSAFPWQRDLPGYAGLGCGYLRSSVDVAAVADPFTGYDIYQSWGGPSDWETAGGTSLSSPVVAAIWALAGGAHGVDYPSLSLYGHFNGDTTRHTYDVTVGGTGACDTASLGSCYSAFGDNPNAFAYGFGSIDCGFGAFGATVVEDRWQCYARPGYDGAAGVGTPEGVGAFTRTGPHAVIASPGTVKHRVAKKFSAAGTTDPFPGGRITHYAWSFGDGHTATGRTPSHTYATKGTRTITLTVTDSYGFTAHVKRRVSVR